MIYGVINYLDNQGNIVESIDYDDAAKFEKEIIDSLDCGRPFKVLDYTNIIYRDCLKNHY